MLRITYCFFFVGLLQEHGRDLVHRLDLLEALFDHRLPFVGLKHLGR